jgi:hypothetical protein
MPFYNKDAVQSFAFIPSKLTHVIPNSLDVSETASASSMANTLNSKTTGSLEEQPSLATQKGTSLSLSGCMNADQSIQSAEWSIDS